MLVSERLRGLYYLMSDAVTYSWTSVSSLTRRLIALGIISEMRVAIEQLEALNQKLEFELSVEDADIDFDQWLGDVSDIQPIFQHLSYVESENDNGTINKMPDIFPTGKSTSFKKSTIESLKTGLRQLCSEAALNHADIAAALIDGFGKIVSLIREIKEKMTDISDELYENYCDVIFARGLDLSFQEAERDYLLWKDEHDWKSQQALEDKRTQEIVKLLGSGVFVYSTKPTNRDIKDCPIKIQEEALEYNTKLPDNIEIDCARFSKFVFMNECIMWIDYIKLGKYLYKHYKDLSFDEEYALQYFDVMLNFIHHDMAALNPNLAVYLPDYEDNRLQAIFDNAVKIITTCNPYLSEKLPKDFLELYLQGAFYGKIKREVQSTLGKKAIYTNICKMLGMLKASMKVFKVGTTSDQLASCLSPLTKKPNKDSMIRKIDEGASDKNSTLRSWTDEFIKKNCYTDSERLFLEQAKK